MEVQLVLFMFILWPPVLILGVGEISNLWSLKNPEKLQLCLTLAELPYHSRAVVHFHRIIGECSCQCSEKIILLLKMSKKIQIEENTDAFPLIHMKNLKHFLLQICVKF